MSKEEFFKDRKIAVTEDLARAYRAVGAIYKAGKLNASTDQLAMNFLMDRDMAGWASDLSTLKKAVGDCDTTAAINATGTMAGDFKWRCTHGRVTGSVLLAPTTPASIQQIKLEILPR